MAGRPGTLPWNMATFTGSEPVTTLSDNFSFLNNQINDSGAGFTSYAVDTGTANNMIVTLASAPVAYEAGMMVCTVPAFTSTGAAVINVNALGNVPIVNPANIALQGGEINKNSLISLVYDGTSFRIIGPCPLSILFSSSINHTVECAGYTSIFVRASFTATNVGVTLNHVSYGVPISVFLQNGGGASQTLAIALTDPSGTPFTTALAGPAGSASGAGWSNLSYAINAGNAMMFIGNTYLTGNALFSR
jgi:hypothetical protein